ncbi:hypothetical protein D3C76_1337060 [compost metagenome]
MCKHAVDGRFYLGTQSADRKLRRAPGVFIDPEGGFPKRCPSAAQRRIDGSQMRLGMGVAVRLRTMLAKVIGKRTSGAVPTRGNPGATVPEARSVDILPRRPDTTAQRTLEQHVDAGSPAHANRLPAIVE